VLKVIQLGVDGKIPETPKTRRCNFQNHFEYSDRHELNRGAGCSQSGHPTGVPDDSPDCTASGGSAPAGGLLYKKAKEVRQQGQAFKGPLCILAGGETTVTLSVREKAGGTRRWLCLLCVK